MFWELDAHKACHISLHAMLRSSLSFLLKSVWQCLFGFAAVHFSVT